MKKFMALYMAPASTFARMAENTAEDTKSAMDAWMKWARDNDASIVDLGAPLGKTRRITAAGASDATNEIAGYSIMQGDSLESVAAVFADHPHLTMMEGGWVELLAYVDLPGM